MLIRLRYWSNEGLRTFKKSVTRGPQPLGPGWSHFYHSIVGVGKTKMLTAPGIPRRSPIQVLTRPDAAWLPRSDEIGRVQRGVAVSESCPLSRSPHGCHPLSTAVVTPEPFFLFFFFCFVQHCGAEAHVWSLGFWLELGTGQGHSVRPGSRCGSRPEAQGLKMVEKDPPPAPSFTWALAHISCGSSVWAARSWWWLNPRIVLKFAHIFYPWGQFDPSYFNLQAMIIIKIATHFYVSGTLPFLVYQLNSPLN